MYPKNNSKVNVRAAPRKAFLNPHQREELRKHQVERFTKLYAPNDSKMVSDMVKQFFTDNVECNNANLREQESKIRQASLAGKSLSKPPNNLGNANEEGEAQSQRSQKSHKTESNKGMELPSINQRGAGELPNINQSRNGNRTQNNTASNQDMPFRNEEDEWAAISKYNKYMYDMEQDLTKKRIDEKKKAIKSQLDEQVREKERRRQLELEQEASYCRAERDILDIEKNKEAAKQDYLRNKIKFEKEMRDQQMKEINERVQFEKDQEKTLDAHILDKIKDELVKENLKQAKEREDKRRDMRQVMIENEKRKKKMNDMEAQQRAEDIELQKMAIALAQEMEEEKARQIKARSDKIQAQINVSQDKVQDIVDKNRAMDQRNKRYAELRERCLQQKEHQERLKECERKKYLKNFLDKQVDEKNQRLLDEKNRMGEQATMWKNDVDKFNDFTVKRDEEKAKIMSMYKDNLMEQMDLRRNKDKKWACDMNPNERLMNRDLLDQIETVDWSKVEAAKKDPYEFEDNVL